MNKPLIIQTRDFSENLQELINESTLPPFVMLPILAEAVRQLRIIDQQQYEAELKKYETKEDQ